MFVDMAMLVESQVGKAAHKKAYQQKKCLFALTAIIILFQVRIFKF